MHQIQPGFAFATLNQWRFLAKCGWAPKRPVGQGPCPMAAPQDWHTFIDLNVFEPETKVVCIQILEHKHGRILILLGYQIKDHNSLCGHWDPAHKYSHQNVWRLLDILEDWNADSYACMLKALQEWFGCIGQIFENVQLASWCNG